MTELAVQFSGVSRRYPHFALSDISFHLPTGTIMGFIGANGAGKSTTLRILMGLVRQDAGSVNVLGHSMPHAGAEARRNVGFVAEDMHLYPRATIAWHMEFVRSFYPTWDQGYANDLVRRFDLTPVQRVKGLSHGQRMKTVLLLALARRPRLLVLDEPTSGLDPVARHEVIAALTDVMRDEERSILFSSQNTLDVEQIADQLTFIDRGRIVDTGNREEYVDRWRRMRIELPASGDLPSLPGVVERTGSGRLVTVTTEQFSPALVATCESAGATVSSVDRMTLEEIFVATVVSRRVKEAA